MPTDAARPLQSGIGSSGARAAVAAVVKRILGMPDYGAYLAHLKARHPDCPILTERQFFDAYVRTRYGDGPTRCC